MNSPAIGLAFYTVKIRPYRTADFKNLSALDSPYPPFIEGLQKVLKTAPKYDPKHFKPEEKSYGMLKVNSPVAGFISGQVACAESGRSANIHNKLGVLAHKQEVSDSVVTPFYFLASIPENTDTAIICIQTFGLHGIKTLFLTDVIKSLRALYSENGLYYLDFQAIAVGHLYINKYIQNGEVKQLTATKYLNGTDTASKKSKGVKQDITLSPMGRNGRLPNILKEYAKLDKKDASTPLVSSFILSKMTEFYGLPAEAYDDATLTIVLNDRPKKISLKDIDGFATRFDISDKVKRDADGFPTFDSIDAEAKMVLMDVAKKIRK